MKKIGVLAIIVVLLLNTCPAGAVPSFGTTMPDQNGWTAGGEVNVTFDRKGVKDYHEARSTQYFYNLSYGFADWFSVDAKIGLGDVEAKALFQGTARYNVGFAGGYGWRAKLFDDKKSGFKGIWGFEHISVHPDGKTIDGLEHDIIWDDWQVHATAYRQLGSMSPYCGLKWSFLYLIRKIDDDRSRRHSHDPIGLIVGTDIQMNDYLFVNIEGRFIDETALSTGFTVKN